MLKKEREKEIKENEKRTLVVRREEEDEEATRYDKEIINKWAMSEISASREEEEEMKCFLKACLKIKSGFRFAPKW